MSNIAVKENKVKEFIDQSSLIIELLKNYPNFVSLLSVHESKDTIRLKIIDNVFEEFDADIVNALKIIVTSDLFFHARDIFKGLRKALWEKQNIIFGVAWSSIPIEEKQLEKIQEKFKKILNKEVHLINKIDKTLLGGVQVKIKSQNYDGTLKGKMDNLKNIIINNKG